MTANDDIPSCNTNGGLRVENKVGDCLARVRVSQGQQDLCMKARPKPGQTLRC